MSVAFLLLASAGVVVVALAVSGGQWLLVRAFRQELAALAPAGRARVALGLAALPLLAGIAAVVVATAAGWIAGDHCLEHGAHHPHLCAAHAEVELFSGIGLLLGLAAARLGWAVASLAWAHGRAWRLRAALDRLGRLDAGVIRVPAEAGVTACTIGVFCPRVYVSDAIAPRHRAAVVAHERAHADARDPLARALADLLGAFHLPGAVGELRAHLRAAQEHAADERAAAAVGDRLAVAEAILAIARLDAPGAAVAFEGAPVTARVESLLREAPRAEEPARATLVALATLGVVVLVLQAERVHHAVETVLGWIAGGH